MTFVVVLVVVLVLVLVSILVENECPVKNKEKRKKQTSNGCCWWRVQRSYWYMSIHYLSQSVRGSRVHKSPQLF